jgi:TolB protein
VTGRAVALAIAFVLVAAASSEGARTSRQPGGRTAGPLGRSTACPARARGRTEQVDVSTQGTPADAPILRAALSSNGRFVAFSSAAGDLVPGDGNHAADVFVRDLWARQTTRVSVSSAGEEGRGASFFPSISADGRFVAFRSFARNLVPEDRNGVEDVFVHDRATGLTERVSVGTFGEEANGASVTSNISADGNVVAFSSSASNLVPGDRNGVTDVFVRDRVRGRTIRVTVGPAGEADGPSEGSSISANGQVVAFRSFASKLVRGDRNGLPDDFVRDWAAGVTERVNVSSSGEEANAVTFRGALSADGRHVAFRSRASNLVAGDTNEALDVFERDLVAGETRRISVSTDGAQADARAAPQSIRASFFMSRAYLSASGRYVAFGSRAVNLVHGDTNEVPDVFVHDDETGQTVRVSVAEDGRQANDASFVAGISGDGRVVAFVSSANNLVPGDTNNGRDVFVRVRALAAACR